jgi:hypothetical protein
MANCSTRTTVLGMPVNLDIRMADALGNLVDPDAIPMVEIRDSHNVTLYGPTQVGVQKLGVGLYRFVYAPPTGQDIGLWSDMWTAMVAGQQSTATLTFTVLSGTSISPAGAQIGDPPCVSYSDAEVQGINILMAQLKCRLKNSGKTQSTDDYGQTIFVDCPIFTDDELLCFLNGSLSEFNQTPHWTNFGYNDQIVYDRNAHVIVEGAHILALGAQMLIEAGREFTVTDNGITMQPPPLSTTLNNQFGTLLTSHTERLKFIKVSYKPSPVGVGSFRVLAVSPAFLRLRHLRQRQII